MKKKRLFLFVIRAVYLIQMCGRPLSLTEIVVFFCFDVFVVVVVVANVDDDVAVAAACRLMIMVVFYFFDVYDDQKNKHLSSISKQRQREKS